jgi:hypothetical protein
MSNMHGTNTKQKTDELNPGIYNDARKTEHDHRLYYAKLQERYTAT